MKLFAIAALLLSATCMAQNKPSATIRGVVTYFFNKYQGDKPDIGAEVFALDSLVAKNFDESVVDSFSSANFYRGLKESYNSMGVAVPDNVTTQLKKYKGDDDEYFRGLDGRNYYQYISIKASDQVYQATIDATGGYSIDVKPGTYYLFIKSNNRTNMTISEYKGKMYFKKVRIKNQQSMNISHKFDIN